MIEALGEGEFCAAYLVDGRWVVRAAKHAEAADALRREVCLLQRLGDRFDLAVPSPRILHAGDELAVVDGCLLAAHALLPGPSLTQDDYLRLPPQARDRCTAQVAGFLRRLHAVPLIEVAGCGLEDADYADEYGELRGSVSEAVDDALDELLSRLPVVRRVLLHGDLSPDHVLFDDAAQTVTGVIDFGDACIGDPAWDFVYLYEDYGLDFFTRALARYAPGDPESFAARVWALYVLEGADWAAQHGAELDPHLTAPGRLRELMAACRVS